MLRPGSTPWLLHHEMRLLWRRSGLVRNLQARVGVFGTLLLLAVLQLGGVGLAAQLARAPPDALLLLAAGACLFLFLLILADVIVSAADALFLRQDLLWLASAPIPVHRVLTVRLLAITATASMSLLGIGASPLIDGLAWFRGPRMLLAYGAFVALALLAGTIGCLVALLLFRLAGPRRARSLATAIGSLTGVIAMLGVQAHSLLGAAAGDRVWHALQASEADPSLRLAWLPARAALGDPGPVLAVLVLALLLSALGRRLGGGWFIAAALAGTEPARSPARRATAIDRRFIPGGGRLAKLRAKELRLLRRMPGLVGQILFSLVYMLPGLLLTLRTGGGVHGLRIVGAFPVLAAGMVAHLVASGTALSDTCPDLAGSAPIEPTLLPRIRFVIAACASAAILLVPVMLVALRAPRQTPIMLVGMAGAGAMALRNGMRHPQISRRTDLGGDRSVGRAPRGSLVTIGWFVATLIALSVL